MKKQMGWALVSLMVGCGGPTFDSGDFSMVPDAALDGLTEVDTGVATIDGGQSGDIVRSDVRADMVSTGDATGTFEASAEGGGDGGTPEDGGAGDGSDVPTCGDEEVHPQDSPTCRKWIATTAYPLERGCCRRETHTCGHVVTFSPFCVELH